MGDFFDWILRIIGPIFHVISALVLIFLVIAWMFGLGLSGWWLVLGFVPMFVVVYLMRQARSPHGWKRAIIGALLVGLNSMAIVSALLNPYPDIPDNTDPATLEYSVGNLPLLATYYNFDSLFTDRYVVFVPPINQDTVNIEVTMGEIWTVNGDWVLDEGQAVVDCGNLTDCHAPEGTYQAVNTADPYWNINSINYTDMVEFILEVDLPLDDSHVHQWFDLQLTGDFIYPRDTETPKERITLERTLSLYVGTNEEFVTRREYNRWLARNVVFEEEGMLTATIVTFIMGIGFVYYGMRSGRAAFTTKRYPMQYWDLIKVRNFDPKRRFDNPPPFGVEVVNMKRDSIWADAGLLPSDVIVQVDNEMLRNVRDFRKTLKSNPDVNILYFTVWRSGETFETGVPFNVTTPDYQKAKRY